MTYSAWALFAAASAAGALVRWWASLLLDPRGGAGRGTTLVNTAGSVALGVLAGAALHERLDPTVLAVAGAGFCGSLTTFSTFALETVDAADRAGPAPAAAQAALSVLLPLGAAALGLVAAAALWG